MGRHVKDLGGAQPSPPRRSRVRLVSVPKALAGATALVLGLAAYAATHTVLNFASPGSDAGCSAAPCVAEPSPTGPSARGHHSPRRAAATGDGVGVAATPTGSNLGGSADHRSHGPRPSAGPSRSTEPSRVPARPAPVASTHPGGSQAPTRSTEPKPTRTAHLARQGATFDYRTTQHTDRNFIGLITITNTTGRPIDHWRLSFHYARASILSAWDAVLDQGGDDPVVSGRSWRSIAPGQTYQVHFTASGHATGPTRCVFNGTSCTFR